MMIKQNKNSSFNTVLIEKKIGSIRNANPLMILFLQVPVVSLLVLPLVIINLLLL